MNCCKEIRVGGKPARVSTDLPSRGWSLDSAGYVIWTSRQRHSPIRRGMKAHRMAILLRGVYIPSGFHIHHQDFNKQNCCPFNLVLMPGELNPTGAMRDPYTGLFISPGEYFRRYRPDEYRRRLYAEDVA